MKLKYILLLFLLLSAGTLNAQRIWGLVVIEEHHGDEIHTEPIPGVVIYWADEQAPVTSDVNGQFSIKRRGEWPADLVFQPGGFPRDTLHLTEPPEDDILMTIRPHALQEVTVESREKATTFSFMDPRSVESLGPASLKKAACCNLSESFETNASVDVNYTDAVSGTKTIRMLGLDGIYTQIMVENIPAIRGLESKYGLTLIPGTWANSIQITKGTGTVVNGYESMAGQINIEVLKPDQDENEPVYVNLYGNINGRLEANIHLRHRLSHHVSSMLLLHAMDLSAEHDRNNDGFLDMPFNRTFAAMNRWRYSYDAVEGHITAGGSYRNSTGGQVGFERGMDALTSDVYGVVVETKQAYLTWKNGLLFPESKFSTIGLIGSARFFEMDAMLGRTQYKGINRQLYFNSIYEDILGNTFHKFRTGLSFQLDDYRERLNDSTFNRTELVPGAYFEYTFDNTHRTQILLAGRVDYHNLYGLWLTPRVHARYNLNENMILRVSAGKGYRRPNAVAENISYFASSRQPVFGTVDPEVSWNAGGSLTWDFRLGKREGVVRLDYYHSWFENQLVVNLENPDFVEFDMLDGRSFSHAAQIDASYEVMRGLDLSVAYKYVYNRSTFDGLEKDLPFVPRDRALVNVAYETMNRIWKFDATVNFFGYARLPDTRQNAQQFRLKGHSDPYYLLNAQITKQFRHWEVYLGAENLLGYLQPNAILDPENPFGNEFDASMIWGPLNGRIIYIGFRTRIKTKESAEQGHRAH